MYNRVVVLLLLLFTFPAAPARAAPQKSLLTGKRVLFVIADSRFRDEELLVPRDFLEKHGCLVRVVNASGEKARGMLGAVVVPSGKLEDVQVRDWDALVFVGGIGAKQYWDDPLARETARKALAMKKVLGALCLAPVILARAGVLKGKTATVWRSASRFLVSEGVLYRDEAVVVDGDIVTASGPDAAGAFAAKLAELVYRLGRSR